MAVSIASPLTLTCCIVTVGIFVLRSLPITAEPWAPCVCQPAAVIIFSDYYVLSLSGGPLVVLCFASLC